MESFAVFLQPYKALIGTVASYASSIHRLTGVAVCYSIYKQKSSSGTSLKPFLAGSILAILTLRFGIIINDGPVFKSNLFGLTLNTCYLCFYYWHINTTNERKSFWTQVFNWLAIGAVVIAYSFIENPQYLRKRYGYILTIILFYFVGSPLLKLREMIRKKTTGELPFPIVLGGTIVTCMWFLYGCCLREAAISFTNGCMFVMCAIQLSLFFIFPSKTTKPAEKSQ